MSRLLSIFERKEAKRARVEAEIVERSERFRASPTVKIGDRTVLNPTFEGPNPFEVPELLDPDNAGVLLTPCQIRTDPDLLSRRLQHRRDRARSEAYSKTPWLSDPEWASSEAAHRNPRYSAPPLTMASSSDVGYVTDEDPFRKDTGNKATAAPNSRSPDMKEEARILQARRRTMHFPVDYLQVEIPGSSM